jgi:transcription antitermination factor NusG
VRPALFPGYCFISIELQWHAARWSIGVVQLLMDGSGPARVADSIINEIRSRERDGLIELPRRQLD